MGPGLLKLDLKMEELIQMQAQREGESMISARTSEQNEAGRLIVAAKPPQVADEQTSALFLADLSAENSLPVESQDLLAEYDQVDLPKQRTTHPLFMFLSFFWGPIPWLIESSAILSALARRWEVSGIILILLLVDAYLGFWQEYQAGSIIKTFKEMRS
jgi:magnesium-transporting ATPase (P-type)